MQPSSEPHEWESNENDPLIEWYSRTICALFYCNFSLLGRESIVERPEKLILKFFKWNLLWTIILQISWKCTSPTQDLKDITPFKLKRITCHVISACPCAWAPSLNIDKWTYFMMTSVFVSSSLPLSSFTDPTLNSRENQIRRFFSDTKSYHWTFILHYT